MSDDTTPYSEPASKPSKKAPARSRRTTPPRPKKSVEAEQEPSDLAAGVDEVSAAPEPSDLHDEAPSKTNGNDWPEPEISSAAQPSISVSAKRNRRRRKGKGKGDGTQQLAPQNQEFLAAPEPEVTHGSQKSEVSLPVVSQAPPAKPFPSQPQPSPRPKIDPELLTKMAWKIYLAEVSEEGVALIGDSDAKDLSRRCFRLAEIFVEEQMRRR